MARESKTLGQSLAGKCKVVATMSATMAGMLAGAVFAQQAPVERAPATPLIVHDPYFSIWSFPGRNERGDKLTDSSTKHWTGHPQQMNGLVRIDGKPFRIMGRDPGNVPAMEQVSNTLTPTHTRYVFRSASMEIELTFFTPAFLDDLDLLSRPVTYVTWTAKSLDSAGHEVSVFLSASAGIATSYDGQPVTYSRNQTASTDVLSVGTRDQPVLNRSGDDLRIDWGYLHLAVPKDEQAATSISERQADAFAESGKVARADTMEGPVASVHTIPELAVALPMGRVGMSPVSRHVLVSYTETFAIQLFQQNLRPWWQRNGKPVSTMLDEAADQYAALDARGTAFDQELTADLTKSAGEHYAWLCTLAYRQAIGGHKLVASGTGEPMLFGKENFSDGDIDTVDVLYPSSPIFLFFNPKLLQAQILPVMQYAALPNRWKFPFAPHDLGLYPLANGQDYGGGEKTEENQMPVEESGNLLILVDALARMDGSTSIAERFWPQLTQWAAFLKEHGLDPERQLTTDDFAGHVAHNANLSIKAIDALEAYADLAKLTHHTAEARQYDATAKDYAKKWVGLAKEGDHYKLGYQTPDSWSQKYNLVWDKVLDYSLFPASVRQSEIAFYKTKLNTYGLPLDSRKDYTKLDWQIWTATMADNPADFNAFVDPMYRWSNETSSRVPMTDWYDTKTGLLISGFQARTVVGGLFMKALADKPLAEKWRGRAKKEVAGPK